MIQAELLFQVLSNVFLCTSVGLCAYFINLKYKSRLLDYFAAIILAVFASEVLKYFINKPRPINSVLIEGGSFPSTHTTIAFTVFFFYALLCHSLSLKQGSAKYSFKSFTTSLFGFLFKDKIVIIAGFLAMAVASFRILANAHYFSDILAGIILAFIVTIPFMFYDITTTKIRQSI